MAAAVASLKRSASPFFLDEAFPVPPHLAKRVRFTPCAAQQQQQPPPLAFHRQSGTSREAAAARISRAAAQATTGNNGMDECASVLVEQMAAAADVADARSRATWILALIRDAVAERAAAGLRAENAAMKAASTDLKEENAKLREEKAALKTQAAAVERENAVLKRGVVLLQARQEEAASEAKKKMAELEMANYALTVRLRDDDNCRFQAFRGPGAF